MRIIIIVLLSVFFTIPVYAEKNINNDKQLTESKKEELNSKNEQARMKTLQILGNLTNRIYQYKMQNNQLPPNINIFSGGYWSSPIVDGWGNPIIYQNNGFNFNVISLGADGKRNYEFGAGSGYYDMDIIYP
ncbi:type II secretion system protein GspG [Mucispirillum schaedleri]|uniref:type II secretion system protein GspG n=1 Tax=Mucispirillum schaedleri TaxID=248039 RepID=UPI001F578D03|nr:type II secretion system protein GspG [Mucispirillum schaedleri]